MRVLMTTDAVGGVWTYSQELTRGLLARGCKVMLVSMGRQPSPAQHRWASAMADLWPGGFSYFPTEFKLEWMQDGSRCYEESREFLLSCAAAFGAEVLHSNQLCYGALPTDIPKIVVAHSDVLSWSAACLGHYPDPSPWIDAYRKIVFAGLQGADAVVCPTEWMRGEMIRNYDCCSNWMVIPNGRTLAAPARPRTLRAITCGRLWDEAKNIRLLEGLELAMPLAIAGEAEFDREAYDGVHKPNMFGRLTEQEMLDLFSESSVYIAASRYEPFGLAPLEAALCGCAIVANDIPSLREVWDDAAVYFEQNDGASLSAAVAELSREPVKLKKIAQAAYARAVEMYSGERMTNRYLELYRELASDGAPLSEGAPGLREIPHLTQKAASDMGHPGLFLPICRVNYAA